ncbi:MAG: SDR family oxidoreductase [Amoebophilaceae bacterium]|jgi:NAD(P)-dependent dehydrogenase (short-subunit alcohol dehydrogenase family)|nr:SDR family oxidoreductase [Amoebophilaceae bacterium]
MFHSYQDKVVLITGGTKGIGLSTGLAFAKQGAQCVLTYKWERSKTELALLSDAFLSRGYKAPLLVQSDVTQEEDIANLLEQILLTCGDGVEVFVSNVSFATLTRSLDDYAERFLLKSIEYSVWPIVAFIRAIKQTFGCYPRYVLGLSSNGPDAYHVNYDFVAASKALLETMVQYLNYRFREEGLIINAVRARFVKTESLWATFGAGFEAFGERYNVADLFVEASEVGDAILALCSGLMDGIRGQIINVDKGSTFADNIMSYYEQRHTLGIQGHIP